MIDGVAAGSGRHPAFRQRGAPVTTDADTTTTTELLTCPLCEAACGLEVTVRDGAAVRVRGDAQDPNSRGYLCPKGASLPVLQRDPDRLTSPMIRRDGRLQECSWDEAFDEVARLLGDHLRTAGRDSIATFVGNPASHNLSLLLYLPQLLRAVGSGKHFSSASVDVLPKQYACALMYGHSMSLPVPDVDRTDHLLVLGANPLVSNGSMLTAPNMKARLEALQERGGTLVVVDPRRTKTARAADRHVEIRPGTDAWLLAAIAHTICSEGLTRLGRLEELVVGLDALTEALVPFTPEVASGHTGVPAPTIREMARELAGARSAAVYGRIGTCLQEHGTVASWLIEVLNVLTGNLDRPGGAIFTAPVTERPRDRTWLRSQEDDHGRFASRVGDLPETFGELPAAALADEILESGDGQIRALLVVAGNPALSIPDSTKVQAALESLDVMVCIDNYLNETTRHADVILPGEPPLQRPHFPFIARWSPNRYARFNPSILEPDDRPREWEVVLTVAALLAGRELPVDAAADARAVLERRVGREVADPRSPIAGRDPEEVLEAVTGAPGPEQLMDLILRIGRDGDGFGSQPDGLSLAALREQPHGIDLGPPGPQLPDVLVTRSGKIELAPPRLLDELAALDRPAPDVDHEYPMLLIGRRNLRSNNSWMHNVRTLVKGRPQCTALVHPDDAARAGLADGEVARIASRTGAVEIHVSVTDEIRRGVVSIPHGWGHDQPGMRLAVAAGVPGVNSNLLGDASLVDRVTATSVGNGVPVALERAAQPEDLSSRR